MLACSTEKSNKTNTSGMDWSTPDIPKLSVLSIPQLRNRQYGSEFVKRTAINNNSSGYSSFMISYLSDGLLNYARIDIPQASAPIQGYPVLLYSHGWVGIENAPSFNFFLDQKGSQAKYIDALAKQGYVVITPGWRGHGTVNNVPAQGIEFMQSWDNASYLSPLFYAIDMLNALDSLDSLSSLEFSQTALHIDLDKIMLAAHSQGGDTALVMLAIAGEQSRVKHNIAAASIFAGCFLPRLVQGGLYGAMATSPEAFMSGDGTWTKSAVGANGEINPNFLFAYPPDWIATVNRSQWSWQNKTWSVDSVKQAYINKYDQMYDVLKANNLSSSQYILSTDNSGKITVEHPVYIQDAYAKLDAINYPQFLSEALSLHYSDRDYYSPAFWNQQLKQRLVNTNSNVVAYEYPGNTHSLTISKHKWFSEDDDEAGIQKMIARDLNWFSQ
jgi:dienelactone hydrolase